MDRDTTPAATAAEPSTTSDDGAKPKRSSTWGKVQVQPKRVAPRPAQPSQAPTTKDAAVTIAPATRAPAGEERAVGSPASDDAPSGNGTGAPRR
ncbi:MAG: hypothetical protein M3O29_03565, partial [Actinomycetota bacterium]|nr:hypothetical protein [Actinomycetota bacterium]